MPSATHRPPIRMFATVIHGATMTRAATPALRSAMAISAMMRKMTRAAASGALKIVSDAATIAIVATIAAILSGSPGAVRL